jgi:murein L,D-transpeptidase YcbB/YkuD
MIEQKRRGPLARFRFQFPAVALAVAALAFSIMNCHGSPPHTQASAEATPTLTASDESLILETLAASPDHGFRVNAFAPADLADRVRSTDPAVRTPAEQALVQAVLAYARAQHGQGIPERLRPKAWGIRPADYDPGPEFDLALKQGQLKAWLDSLPPPTARYRAMQAAYAAYRKTAADGGWPRLPEAMSLRGQHVRLLRERLAFEDRQIAAASPDAPVDEELKAAVQRAQERYGLEPSGTLGPETLRALNVPADQRATQIRVNLERLRWMPREEPASRIEVNSAANLFDLYQDGAPAMHMLAASGRPGDETPMLVSAIETVVLNPAWHVPPSIARKELIPKSRAHPGYLARAGMSWRSNQLVQRPGPKNSLGRVKFEFPNPYSVYLHDTPAKAAFTKQDRSISHGCVRLQHAVDLAKTLLSGSPGWDEERIDRVLDGRTTTHVRLPRPVPVMLFYGTAFPMGDEIAFRDDVYGWDEEMLRLLDATRASQA